MSISNLNLKDIKAFLTAYDTRSISKAAEELYTSRQSVRRSITNLENMLETQLFASSSEGVTPTAAANEFYHGALKLYTEAEALLDSIKLNADERDVFRLGIIGQYKAGSDIERLVKEYIKEHPSYSADVRHLEWPKILDEVREGNIDFAFIAYAKAFVDSDLVFEKVKSDDFYLIARSNSAVAKSSFADATVLEQKSILLLSPFSIQQEFVKDYARKTGIVPSEMISTSDVYLLEAAALEGTHNVAVLGHIADSICRNNKELIPIPFEPPLKRTSGIIYRKDHVITRSQKAILRYIKLNLK